MNIFLPYENSPTYSAMVLDDKRLLKQILETRQILQVAEGESEGFKNHPITKHYIQYKAFLAYYGCCCCLEYAYRFNKRHKYCDYFEKKNNEYRDWANYVPYYAAGAKNSPNCVRTTENVSELYQNKLCEKWDEDTTKGRPPKWTRHITPEFYYKRINKEEK